MKRQVLRLGLLYATYLTFVIVSAPKLPDPVATHFDFRGHPDGWMSRSSHLAFAILMGALPPAFVMGIFYGFRFVPTRYFNLPNRDYWLAPERRNETLEYFQRQGAWFACLILVFITGVQFLIVQANSRATLALSSGLGWLFAASFLVAIALWAISLIQRFRRIA